MKTLVLCGDRWHRPQIPQACLSALSGTEFTFDFMENAHDWSSEVMASYRCVILTKSNNVSYTDHSPWMTDTIQAAFVDHVARGNGLLAVHSGTAEYADKPVLRGLLGGVFVQHPEQCPVTMEPKPEHPLCANVATFTIQDEHYFMALDDQHADVFMTTRSVHGGQPGSWRREVGKGRVSVLTPGHNLEVWQHPSFQALLGNCLRWCSRLK